ncbi:hypothetical protein [Agrobacterium rubi]|uniref:hypothetical protein n=1 Tax=Agrobacterium rubi TaxID=28099 RepID=UPI001AB01EBE|nr:hypothetical protein [Agrobacterium rubi]
MANLRFFCSNNLITAAGGSVVVDDCRFPNEAAEIRKLGGVVWKIVGRGGIVGSHESEAGCGVVDLLIANDNDPAGLFDKVDGSLHRFGKK